MTTTPEKSSEELENLTTPRLLAFYKAERKRVVSEACPHDANETRQIVKENAYLQKIKGVLDSREDVKL